MDFELGVLFDGLILVIGTFAICPGIDTEF